MSAGRRRRFDVDLEGDPLSLLVNFFDCSIVFALAFMVALMTASGAGEKGHPVSEALRARSVRLDRYRETRERLRGEGERLGTAYRLTTGEVVYVPEDAADTDGR